MAVWNPGGPTPPPISFTTTAVEIPSDVPWQTDRYIDVEPTGCIAAHAGDDPCTPPAPPEEGEEPTEPTPQGPRWTVGCEACGDPLCIQHLPDPVRFHWFPMHSRIMGCEGSDGTNRLLQALAALDGGASAKLAERYFSQLDGLLDPALNMTPGGPTCARLALRAVLLGRAAKGLSTGGLAMDYGTALALAADGLAGFAQNGVQVGNLQGTTDYGMPKGGGVNLTGAGGGWIAALPTRPGWGIGPERDQVGLNPTEDGPIPDRFIDKSGSGCYTPSAKRYGIVAFDPGCVTYADVNLACEAA